MSNSNFNSPPTIALLAQLVNYANLAQSQVLPKAIRLWVMLRSFYGDLDDPIRLFLKGDGVGTSKWKRDIENKDDAYEDRTCAEWLFEPNYGVSDPEEWKADFALRYGVGLEVINALILTEDCTPFNVSRKTIGDDLSELAERGWLGKKEARRRKRSDGGWNTDYKYFPLPEWPGLPETDPDLHDTSYLDVFLSPTLSGIAETIGQPVGGVQRFFFHVENVVSNQKADVLEDLINQLKTLWQADPTPPIKLTYRSARCFQAEISCVVYPVCVCYFHRAPYLYALGQTPLQDQGNPSTWYDFRLDRIMALEILDWQHNEIPVFLSELKHKSTLPTPEQVLEELDLAMGFDLFAPIEPMILRFDRYFYGNYIENTERAKRLTLLPALEVERLINGAAGLSITGQQRLLQTLRQFPKDTYCKLPVRQQDRNVLMRLRSWSPNVEVLLPWSWREQMINDLQKTWSLYR